MWKCLIWIGVGGVCGERGGNSVFERSSWKHDDRAVFRNLRGGWSVLFPLDDRSRKEGFYFQRLSFIYITYFHRWDFQRKVSFFPLYSTIFLSSPILNNILASGGTLLCLFYQTRCLPLKMMAQFRELVLPQQKYWTVNIKCDNE